MNTTFTPPSQYLCVGIGLRRSGGTYLDVAFLPIPVGATYSQCLSYIEGKHCEIMRDSDRALEVLNLLGDHLPKTGRVIIVCARGGITVSGNRAETLRCEELFTEGDLLLCCRDSVYGMSDVFPKEPFVGKCNMVEANEPFDF